MNQRVATKIIISFQRVRICGRDSFYYDFNMVVSIFQM